MKIFLADCQHFVTLFEKKIKKILDRIKNRRIFAASIVTNNLLKSYKMSTTKKNAAAVATIEINGKTYQNNTERLADWLQIDGVSIDEISAKFGTPIYLVRQMYDANGQLMERGQKTLAAFETANGIKLYDKTTINRAFGVAIAARGNTGNTGNTGNGKTNAERAAAAVAKVAAAVADLGMTETDSETAAQHFAAVIDLLTAAAETERETAAAAAKRAAAIAALVAVGFDAETAAATVDRQGK